MVGIFAIAKTNYSCVLSPNSVPSNKYQFWVRFLNDMSNIRYALTAHPTLIHNALCALFTTAIDTSSNSCLAFTFQLNERTVRVTEQDLNRILRFPSDNLVPDPSIIPALKLLTTSFAPLTV